VSDPKNVRLYGILARDSPRVVLFRRGPSKQVLLLTWDTSTDKIEEGQWLKGRIYERRCDLSPDGKLLIYFASNQKPGFGTWTAISAPPRLTAISLWPKGDAWGGGGLFVTRNHLLLNHSSNQFEMAEGFRLPSRMKVEQFRRGLGEDNPIWAARLERDGWTLISKDFIWEKTHPTSRHVLRMTLRGMMERGGPWYVMDHAVVDADTGEEHLFERSDWADWSHDGDLLFATHGAVYRAKCGPYGLGEPALVMDLSDRKFVNRE
jgi:hypothetical protein